MKYQRGTQPFTIQEPTFIDAMYLTTNDTDYPPFDITNILSKHKDSTATHQTQYIVEHAPERHTKWKIKPQIDQGLESLTCTPLGQHKPPRPQQLCMVLRISSL
jgi:hypothetical protein